MCACPSQECASPGKHPVGWLVPHGFHDASADADRIEGWWRKHPSANVGVTTGNASGLIVIDIDPRHGGRSSLSRLERTHGTLPRTVTALTGGGGTHLYFAAPPAPVPSHPGILSGLDLKGEGGYVIAPPSRHASGKRYLWATDLDPDSVELASPPDWLLRLELRARMHRGTHSNRAPTPASLKDQVAFIGLMHVSGIDPGPGVQEMFCCPWHSDEHPSLSVHWEAALFHCFGCGVGGGLMMLARLVDAEQHAPLQVRRD